MSVLLGKSVVVGVRRGPTTVSTESRHCGGKEMEFTERIVLNRVSSWKMGENIEKKRHLGQVLRL